MNHYSDTYNNGKINHCLNLFRLADSIEEESMTFKTMEAEIDRIKQQIFELGNMRPGSLTRQMRKSKEKYGAYWQLSYTYRGKGKTEYIRDAFAGQVKTETTNFKRYRKLTDRLIELSIKLSRLKMDAGKKIGQSG
jgi:hypothetical protein